MHDGLSRLLKVWFVAQCGGGADNGQAVERVGIEAVLDAFQGVDQGSISNGITDAKSGQRMRFGKRPDHQQIRVTIDQRDGRGNDLFAEVDVGFVDDHD